jgi:hypothetical protein
MPGRGTNAGRCCLEKTPFFVRNSRIGLIEVSENHAKSGKPGAMLDGARPIGLNYSPGVIPACVGRRQGAANQTSTRKEDRPMTKTKLLLAAAAAVLASSVAIAAPASFKKADANGDGSVDTAEFAASGVKGKKFEKLDKDGDGKLSKKEYSAALDEDCA